AWGMNRSFLAIPIYKRKNALSSYNNRISLSFAVIWDASKIGSGSTSCASRTGSRVFLESSPSRPSLESGGTTPPTLSGSWEVIGDSVRTHLFLHEPLARESGPQAGGEAVKEHLALPLSRHEGQGRRKASGGEGRVTVAAEQPFGGFAKRADEGGVDLVERLPCGLGGGVDAWCWRPGEGGRAV